MGIFSRKKDKLIKDELKSHSFQEPRFNVYSGDLDISDMAYFVKEKMNLDLHREILSAIQSEARNHGWDFIITSKEPYIPLRIKIAIASVIGPVWVSHVRPYLKNDRESFNSWVKDSLYDGFAFGWLDSVLAALKEKGIHMVPLKGEL